MSLTDATRAKISATVAQNYRAQVDESSHPLKRLRAKNFLTQADLAAMANLSVQTISILERGRSVSKSTVRRIEAALGEQLPC